MSEQIPGVKILFDRLVSLENANLSDRLNYLQSCFDSVVSNAKDTQFYFNTMNEKLRELDKRLEKIESFTDYLLDYFNPDNKLKAEVTNLEKLLKAKEQQLSKLKELLK